MSQSMCQTSVDQSPFWNVLGPGTLEKELDHFLANGNVTASINTSEKSST